MALLLHEWTRLMAAVGIGIFAANDIANAEAVTISRRNEGVICSGWAVYPGIIATAAHCVLARGTYSVSVGDESYPVLRIWIHPEFSPERLYLTLLKEEFDHDIALLQIVRTSVASETHGYLKDKTLLPGAALFSLRPKGVGGENSREIEELAHTKLQITKKGVEISNDGKNYDICPGDSGSPVFARIAGGVPMVVGIIVGDVPLGRTRSAEWCATQVRIIDAATILEFVHSRSNAR